jgi:hypothetical protein
MTDVYKYTCFDAGVIVGVAAKADRQVLTYADLMTLPLSAGCVFYFSLWRAAV